MKKVAFLMKKNVARALVAAGAALGLSSCFHVKNSGSIESVYGPPSDVDPEIQVVEDVYGPPVESIDTASDNQTSKPVLLPKNHDSQSNE